MHGETHHRRVHSQVHGTSHANGWSFTRSWTSTVPPRCERCGTEVATHIRLCPDCRQFPAWEEIQAIRILAGMFSAFAHSRPTSNASEARE